MRLEFGSEKTSSSQFYPVGGTVVSLLALTMIAVVAKHVYKKTARKHIPGQLDISESLSPQIEFT